MEPGVGRLSIRQHSFHLAVAHLAGEGLHACGAHFLVIPAQSYMLIADYEGLGQITDFQLGNSSNSYQIQQTTVELNVQNWISSQLGWLVSYADGAYNNMPLTGYGVNGCGDLYIGLGGFRGGI